MRRSSTGIAVTAAILLVVAFFVRLSQSSLVPSSPSSRVQQRSEEVPRDKTLEGLGKLEPPVHGTTIFGRVVETDGRPVLGATLLVRRDLQDSEASALRGMTDADGKFVLGVPSGLKKVNVSVSHAFSIAGKAAIRKLIVGEVQGLIYNIVAGQNNDLGSIILKRSSQTYSLSGRVIDQRSNPVRDFELHMERDGVSVATEGNRFVISAVDERQVEFWIVAQGYAENRNVGRTSMSSSDMLVVLGEGWTIRGRVINTDGQGIPSAIVTLSYGAGWLAIRETKSDVVGSFSVARVGSERGPFSLSISAKGYRRQQYDIKPPHISMAGEILVVLSREDDQLATISLDLKSGRPHVGEVGMVLRVARAEGVSESFQVKEGQPVPAGSYLLEVRVPGFSVEEIPVVLRGGENVIPLALNQGGTAGGAIRTFTNEIVAGAIVTAYSIRSGRKVVVDSCITGQDGAFFLQFLPAERILLSVRHQGYESVELEANTVSGQHVSLNPMLKAPASDDTKD